MTELIAKTMDMMELCHREGVRKWRPKLLDSYNAIIYSYTVVTSTGYGDVYPLTATARLLTIVYAMLGIPLNIAFVADFGEWITTGISKGIRSLRQRALTNDHREVQISDRILFLIFFVLATVYLIFLTLVVWYAEKAQNWDFIDSLHFTFSSISLIGFGDLTMGKRKLYVFFVMPLLLIGETLLAIVFGHIQRVVRFDMVAWMRIGYLQVQKAYRRRRRKQRIASSTGSGAQSTDNITELIEREKRNLQEAPSSSEIVQRLSVPLRSEMEQKRKVRSTIKELFGGTPSPPHP